jgi:kinetochore protein Mis13/DSN1
MATNRATARRRSARTAFEDDDAPVVKRAKTDVNGPAKKTNGVTRKAAKTGELDAVLACRSGVSHGFNRVQVASLSCTWRAGQANRSAAYDEDDDGFQFTRRTSRRTTKAQPAPEPIPEEPSKPPPARRKKSIAAPEPEQAEPQRKRRSARLSSDKDHLDQIEGTADAAKAAPKRAKKAALVEKVKVTPAPELQPEENVAPSPAQTPKFDGIYSAKKRDGATKIMLPFADTPVINRNKEMRKGGKDGHRRSSTGLRGRRASSLIESGMSNGKCCATAATSREPY